MRKSLSKSDDQIFQDFMCKCLDSETIYKNLINGEVRKVSIDIDHFSPAYEVVEEAVFQNETFEQDILDTFTSRIDLIRDCKHVSCFLGLFANDNLKPEYEYLWIVLPIVVQIYPHVLLYANKMCNPNEHSILYQYIHNFEYSNIESGLIDQIKQKYNL